MRILVIGIGNPGRTDDGLGVALAEKVESWQLPSLSTSIDCQLNPEHAAEVAEAELVIFIDASVEAKAPYRISKLIPAAKEESTTHSMAPETVLEVCRKVYGKSPVAFLLEVRGEDFAIGEGLSSEAKLHLGEAERFLTHLFEPGFLPARCLEAAGR